MPHIIKSKWNNGICSCGKKRIHHHYYCDECWQILKKSEKVQKMIPKKSKRKDNPLEPCVICGELTGRQTSTLNGKVALCYKKKCKKKWGVRAF